MLENVQGNITGGAQQMSLGSFGALRGLVARDMRRNRALRLVTEAPRTSHSVVVLGDGGGIVQGAKDALRALMLRPPRALPPRMWYRLESLGGSYEALQRSQPFTVQVEPRRGGCVLRAPEALADSLQQVLVVSRHVRLVMEVATRIDDGGWLIRGAGVRRPRHACFVLVGLDGTSMYLPCAAAKKGTSRH